MLLLRFLLLFWLLIIVLALESFYEEVFHILEQLLRE